MVMYNTEYPITGQRALLPWCLEGVLLVFFSLFCAQITSFVLLLHLLYYGGNIQIVYINMIAFELCNLMHLELKLVSLCTHMQYQARYVQILL